jgi:hypothetical protein
MKRVEMKRKEKVMYQLVVVLVLVSSSGDEVQELRERLEAAEAKIAELTARLERREEAEANTVISTKTGKPVPRLRGGRDASGRWKFGPTPGHENPFEVRYDVLDYKGRGPLLFPNLDEHNQPRTGPPVKWAPQRYVHVQAENGFAGIEPVPQDPFSGGYEGYPADATRMSVDYGKLRQTNPGLMPSVKARITRWATEAEWRAQEGY